MCKGHFVQTTVMTENNKRQTKSNNAQSNVQDIAVLLCVHAICLKLSVNSKCGMQVGNVNPKGRGVEVGNRVSFWI